MKMRISPELINLLSIKPGPSEFHSFHAFFRPLIIEMQLLKKGNLN